jgi:hypothetical protein
VVECERFVILIVPPADRYTIVCKLPGLDVATYEVIGDPPLSKGALKLSCAELVPVSITFVILGALGIVGASAGVEAKDGVEVPWLLIATTLNVYVVPGVRPVIFAALIWAGVYVAATAAGLDVTR